MRDRWATREWVVCTLKDAVKLGPLWPRLAPPLWYVSQQVMVERGVGGLEHILDELVTRALQSRQTLAPPADAGPFRSQWPPTSDFLPIESFARTKTAFSMKKTHSKR